MMDQENVLSSDAQSKHITMVLHSGTSCLKKKRKLQAEQLGMPLPKHACADQRLITKHSSSFDNELETESGKGSNTITEDIDCVVSDEPKAHLEYLKSCASNCPSTSSATVWSKDVLYSLESRSALTDLTKECDFLEENYRWHRSLDFEDDLMDLGNHVECSCSECIGTCSDKELEDMLYSNGLTAHNFVLSSGRWKVGQDAQESSKKLTIDKEFEQYFGMLML